MSKRDFARLLSVPPVQRQNELEVIYREGLFNLPAEEYRPDRSFLSRGREMYDFCSTNYLSFEYREQAHLSAMAFARKWGTLPSWSRMEADPHIYPELEAAIGSLIGAKQTLLAHNITLSNFSNIPGIVQKGIIFAERRVHAVVWEACRLARDHGASIVKFSMHDLAHLEELLKKHRTVCPKLIALDGVNSITTELAPVRELQRLCEEYDAWLLLDDAHGFGILGKEPSLENPYGVGGGGVVAHFGGDYRRTFYVTSFGKAFCTHTAFCTVPDLYRENMKSYALQYLYSAPPSPYLIGAAMAMLKLNEAEGEQERKKIRELVGYLTSESRALGIQVKNNILHPVVFLEVGRVQELMKVAAALAEGGILAGLRAYPVVPETECGLRFAVTSANSRKQIDRILEILNQPIVKQQFGRK